MTTKTKATKKKPAGERVQQLPIGKLEPSPDNPRRKVGDVRELAASIKAVGILEPLIAVKNGKGYTVVAGARRLAAAKAAGLRQVPVIVRDLDDVARAEVALVENLQRQDLEPLEEARAFQALISTHGYSQRDVATRIGRAQSHVSKRLALLQLPKEAQKAVDSGGIGVAAALDLVRLKDHPERVDRILEELGPATQGIEIEDEDVGWRVDQELRDVERGREYEEARAKAEAQSVRLVEGKRDKYGNWRPPAGSKILGKAYNELGVDAKKHRKKDCHAITVEVRYGGKPKIRAICTDPKSHVPPAKRGPSRKDEEAARAKEREAREAHDQALTEARERRVAFLRELFAGKIRKDEALQLILWGTVNGSDIYVGVFLAAELVGLKRDGEVRAAGGAGDALTAYAKQSQTNLERAALAAIVGAYEEWLGESGLHLTPADQDVLARYYAFLKAHGYEASPTELLEISGKGPR